MSSAGVADQCADHFLENGDGITGVIWRRIFSGIFPTRNTLVIPSPIGSATSERPQC